MIFETHAHYDDEKFDQDRVELLSHILKESNIDKVVNVGASFRGCVSSLDYANTYENVYAALGIHPEEKEDFTENSLSYIRENAKNSKVVAIGEIGLDYYWCKEEAGQAVQREWFLKQLQIAQEFDMPVIIHSRDACQDTLEILSDYKRLSGKAPGIIHCFSYTKETALEYVKRGWYIGVGGVVTFKNGKKLVETVKEIPLQSIVLETDAPYMAPTPFRGERNNSIYLKYVAEKIAEIKDVTVEEVEAVTYQNSVNIFLEKDSKWHI